MRSLLLCFLVLAGCEDPPRPAVAPRAETSREELCVRAARECGHHAIDGKSEALIDCMPDEVVARIGGRARILETLKANEQERLKDGTVEESVIDPPTQVLKGTKRTFAVVPQTIGVTVPEGRVVLKSFLLGVSADDGKTWRFIDGVELDRDSALELFPDLPPNLSFPAVDKPVLESPRDADGGAPARP